MKKALMILILALLAAFSFTACRKNSEEKDSEQQAESLETEKTVEETIGTEEGSSEEETTEYDTAGDEEVDEPFIPLEVEESVTVDLEEGQEGGY